MKKIRVLYIQVPKGGGSLYALYEMVKCIDTNTIEPIIICLEKNKYTTILDNLGCKIIYLKVGVENKENNTSNNPTFKKPNFFRYSKFKKFLYSIYKYYKNDNGLLKEIETIILSLKTDIVHHNNDMCLNRQFVRVVNKLSIPQILHNRSLKNYDNDKFNFWVDKKLIRKIDYHINISNAVQKNLVQQFHVAAKKNIVVRDIIDTNKYKPQNISPSYFSEFNVAENDIIISNIGRIIPWKGQELFIESIKLVIQDNPHVKALIVGSYENGVGEINYYNKLKKLVADYHLEKNIFFTGNRNDVNNIINMSHLIVHSSTKPEPQGLVILEALFCKKPVIVSTGGGAEELAKLYGAATFTSNNVASLVNRISEFLANPNQFVNNQNIYFQNLLNDFDANKQILQIENLYYKLAGRV